MYLSRAHGTGFRKHSLKSEASFWRVPMGLAGLMADNRKKERRAASCILAAKHSAPRALAKTDLRAKSVGWVGYLLRMAGHLVGWAHHLLRMARYLVGWVRHPIGWLVPAIGWAGHLVG